MKRKFFILLFGCIVSMTNFAYSQSVGINTEDPDPNSVLEVKSTEKGVLLPRVTMDQRNAINPGENSNGLTVYNTTTSCYSVWNAESKSWTELCPEQTALVDFSSCDLIKVVGVYDMDKPISAQTVRIDVPVRVLKLGKYNYSASCNGVTFSASGTFVNIGPTTVSLYVNTSGGTPTSPGTYPATVIITPVEGTPSTVTCSDNINVKFINRSTATMKVLNIYGNTRNTGLTSSGGNYSSSSVYAAVGTWLKSGGTITIGGQTGQRATSFSGTANIQVVDVAITSLAVLQSELQDASIVWMASATGVSNGFAQLVAEWYKAGKGVLMITGDKDDESTVADACGYYIEDGSAATGTTWGSRLPQVFSKTNGAPFEVGDGLSIGYDGSNCGYISSNKGVSIMSVTSNRYPSAFADIDNGIFIFGDKFGYVSSGTTWNNFGWVLTDIFAWSLKNAPIY